MVERYMIETIGNLDGVLLFEPGQFIFTQWGERIIVEVVSLDDGYFWWHLALKPNNPRQSNSQHELSYNHVPELAITVTPMTFLQMSNIKMNKNVHQLCHCYYQDYGNKIKLQM